jgi:hypothetical protein
MEYSVARPERGEEPAGFFDIGVHPAEWSIVSQDPKEEKNPQGSSTDRQNPF